MSVGKNIRDLREKKGITQTELAEALGVTVKAVSAWECETNLPRMGIVEKLSSYFNVSKSFIVEEELELFALNRDIKSLTPEDRERVKEFIKALNATRKT